MSQTVNLGHVVGPGVPNGGTAGQVLKKNSGTNFDTSWSDNNAATIPMSGSDNTSIGNAMSKILPVITGTTNNSGYAIAAGEYFEANGGLYRATASIPVDSAWSSSATALTDHGAVNALNSKLTNLLEVRRSSVLTASINSGKDKEITYNNVINNVSPSAPTGYSVLSVCAEGVYPSTTWDCKPHLSYVNATNTWQVHNNGTVADTATATFIVTYIKNS